MKKTVYIETSVISFLTARTSHNVILAGHQASTEDFWEHRSQYRFFVSDLVVDECSKGDEQRALSRLRAIKDVPLLEITLEVEKLALLLLDEKVVPASSEDDAIHIAIAAVEGTDFIVTWNFKHINNPVMKRSIERVVVRCGYDMPVICSPEELEVGSYGQSND